MDPLGLQSLLHSACVEMFARNTGSNGRRDYYEVVVSNVRSSPAVIEFDLALTFKAGERYCCFEDGCHHGLFGKESWKLLRQVLGTLGFPTDPPLLLSVLRVRVERGARASYGGLKSGDQEIEPRDYEYTSGPFSESDAKG
jgi:hypothetical protein